MSQEPIPYDDEITLADIWLKLRQGTALLWRKKWWLLIVVMLSASVGYFKVKLAKPTYSATLTFSLEQGSGKGSNIAGLAAQFGFSLGGSGGGTFEGDNLLEIMKSRRLIQEVLMSPIWVSGDSVLLVNQYVRSDAEMMANWEAKGLYPVDRSACCSNGQDSAIGYIHADLLEESMSVYKEDDQNIVSLTQNSHNPEFSANFVELLSEKAIEFYLDSKTANNRANLDKLQKRVDSVTVELEAAMLRAGKANDADQYTVQSVARVSSLEKQMKVTMLTTLYGELVKNLELSKTLAAREEPLITVIDRPHYPLRVRESAAISTLLFGLGGGFLYALGLFLYRLVGDLNRQASARMEG